MKIPPQEVVDRDVIMAPKTWDLTHGLVRFTRSNSTTPVYATPMGYYEIKNLKWQIRHAYHDQFSFWFPEHRGLDRVSLRLRPFFEEILPPPFPTLSTPMLNVFVDEHLFLHLLSFFNASSL